MGKNILARPTVAHVDLSAITDNIRAIRARVGENVLLMPAVKANGYGHGAVQVSRACLDGGADILCVASTEEGVQLREAGIQVPILILGCSTTWAVELIVRYNIASTVCDLGVAKALSEEAVKRGAKAVVHVKVDTGMGRIGLKPQAVISFVETLLALPGLWVEGIFTHFPSADEPDRSFTLSQIESFRNIIADLRARGIQIKLTHASNSGAILGYPEADFDAVRPGIMIYGHYPSLCTPRTIALREALTLQSKLVFLKNAEAGDTVSYGRTHALRRHSKIATVPLGYADGYLRAFSNRGEAAVNGHRVPVVGRVCMDQLLVDVTDVPDVRVGDDIFFYGGGYDFLSLVHVAERIGTIPNELLCALNARVPRLYF